MNTHFKVTLILTVIVGLCVSAVAMAGESWLNAGSKMRGEFGTTSRSPVASTPIYRSAPPVVAQSQPAPNTVAQAPTEERRFSYEPAKPAEKKADATVRTNRRFSYEPGYSSGSMSRSSSRPLYELPKTDSRRFGGGR